MCTLENCVGFNTLVVGKITTCNLLKCYQNTKDLCKGILNVGPGTELTFSFIVKYQKEQE